MPGLTGAELIARIRQDFPDMPILHVDDIGRRGRVAHLPEEVPTIYKPFSIASLSDAVRDFLSDPGS